jgi:hypothetical protein
MIVGFTGTQQGMTGDQAAEVARILIVKQVTEAHHGDCVGADEQFHAICLVLEIPIIGHPPDNDYKRAFCEGFEYIHPPKPFLERNHDIVDESMLMLAAPKEREEQQRSGTWSTVRYARGIARPLLMVWP